jgi:hypothetical protein
MCDNASTLWRAESGSSFVLFAVLDDATASTEECKHLEFSSKRRCGVLAVALVACVVAQITVLQTSLSTQ